MYLLSNLAILSIYVNFHGGMRLDFFGDDNSHFAKISLVLKCYLGIPVAGELSLLRRRWEQMMHCLRQIKSVVVSQKGGTSSKSSKKGVEMGRCWKVDG